MIKVYTPSSYYVRTNNNNYNSIGIGTQNYIVSVKLLVTIKPI